MESSNKNKSWLWWLIFGLISGAGAQYGFGEVTPIIADTVATSVSENTSIDD